MDHFSDDSHATRSRISKGVRISIIGGMLLTVPVRICWIRSFATDKHQSVDDQPFGGGAGMVMRPDIVDAALGSALAQASPGTPAIYLTPRGRMLDQARVNASFTCIAGHLFYNSDWMPDLPPDRLDILKRTMPAHGLLPRPVDLFENEPARMWHFCA